VEVTRYPIREGITDALLDVVANPWTVGTFALVTTLGPLAMNQNRFPRIKGATCWVMRDGMRAMYYVGLGITGGKAVYGLYTHDNYEVAHSATLGGMLVTTKFVGDRYMGVFLESLGHQLIRWSAHMPSRMGQWMTVQGKALVQTATDQVASTGLALCAHSLDEIAALTVAVKFAVKTAVFRVQPSPHYHAPSLAPSIWPIVGFVAVAGALAIADGPLPFGDAAAAVVLRVGLAL